MLKYYVDNDKFQHLDKTYAKYPIIQRQFWFVFLIKMEKNKIKKTRIIGDLDPCTGTGGIKHLKRQRASFFENLGIIMRSLFPNSSQEEAA